MSTNIKWTDETWNPLTGCSKISLECVNCYAEVAAKSARLQQFEQYQKVKSWDGTIFFAESQLAKPLHWKKPRKIFVCSMSDLFHPNVKMDWTDKIFEVIEGCPQHIFQLLTKRPERMRNYLEQFKNNPLPNAWVGTTAGTQETANQRIPFLQQTPAAVRFLSCEPLLGRIDLDLRGIHWVIAGGESGAGYRPVNPDWVRHIRDQCEDAGVPFFFKQWGGKTSNAGGNELDGVIYEQFPMNQPSYPNFQSMPAKELRKYAKERGVTGYSGLDKDSLITKLCRHILICEGFNLDVNGKEKASN